MSVRKRIHQRRFASATGAAVVSLMVAADHLKQAFDDICARHGITGQQYNLLRILRGAHPRGQARREIAQRCIHRSPDVTRLLDRLVRQGLVTRAPASEDRRCSVARITQAGLALLARIDPEIEAEAQRLMAPLSKTDSRRLARLCDALVPEET
jgi:DNA-binding MarR family transcriptional regulator